MDGIAQIVLDNIKLPSEKAELLIPFFRQIKQQYGDPVALVHDMGRGILSAINTVFPGIPDFTPMLGNFFNFMMQHFDIDVLLDYGVTEFPDTEKVINPTWRQLNRSRNSLSSKHIAWEELEKKDKLG